MRTLSFSASHARDPASGVQRLEAQRQAAAAARAHVHALQIKVTVALGCTLAAVLGYALHRASVSVANVDRVALTAPLMGTGQFTDLQIGQVQVPYDGDTCRRFHFNNKSGAIMGESFATCGLAESVAQPLIAPTRAEAIMSAFRVAR